MAALPPTVWPVVCGVRINRTGIKSFIPVSIVKMAKVQQRLRDIVTDFPVPIIGVMMNFRRCLCNTLSSKGCLE